jgi:cation:H+ antiporter
VIGSDIFNMLGVLGVAALAQPMHIDAMARTSLWALTAMVLLVVVFMRTGWRVSRVEGLILLLLATGRWILNLSV